MKEGFWLNYRTWKIVEVYEHERWLKEKAANPKSIGVPENVMAIASKIKNREKFLIFVMQHAPVMRIRGYGTSVSLDFHTRNRQEVMDAILMWGKKYAGPFTWLNMSNFATRENTQMNYEQFKTLMDDDGADAVLRVASANQHMRIQAKLIRELLAVSQELARMN